MFKSLEKINSSPQYNEKRLFLIAGKANAEEKTKFIAELLTTSTKASIYANSLYIRNNLVKVCVVTKIGGEFRTVYLRENFCQHEYLQGEFSENFDGMNLVCINCGEVRSDTITNMNTKTN